MMAFLLLQCKSATVYTFSERPSNHVAFGSFGGFSGNIITYYVLQNGQRFKTESISNDTTNLSSIKPSDAKKIFKQMEKIEFNSLKINSPSNMTYFIVNYYDDKEHSIAWGENGEEPPAKVAKLYQMLTNDLR